MPSLIGSLFVSLTADFQPFQRNMRSAEGVVASTAGSMRRNIGLTERSVHGLQRTMGTGIRPYSLIAAARTFDTVQSRANLLRGALFATTAAFGGLGAALTTNVISRYLDSFTGLENQMRVVSDGSADLAAQMESVGNVAERSRASLQAVAVLYSRLAKAAPGEGAATLLRRVETINKGLQLGGATAQEATSAAIQFSQAIASNRLGGEELRAVLETPLGLELAKGMGVTIGKFREMGFAGDLTADVLFAALDKIAGKIDGDFAKSISTIDQALVVADAKITEYAGSLDDAYGITKLMAGAIVGFGNNLESIIPVLGSVGLLMGSVFAGRLAGGFTGGRVGVIRAENAARKEGLRLAKEDLYTARAAAYQAKENLRAAKAGPEGGALALAPKSELKAYQRELSALEKADAAHLKTIAQKAEINQQLSEITRKATVGEIRASEAIATQQAKLNDLYRQSRDLKRQEARAQTAVTGATGMQATSATKVRALAAAQKDLVALQKEQTRLVSAIGREENTLGRQRATLTREYGASFTAAANQRASLLVAEKQLVADLARSEAQRAAIVGRARAARGIAQTSGQALIAGNIATAARGVDATAAAAARAATNLTIAQRAATGLSTALGVTMRVGGSLVGFLGGPWGVAFTTAIGLMTYFGIRARRTAQEVANAQAVIAEELERLGQGGAANISPNEQRTLIENTIRAETDRMKQAMNELDRAREEIATSVSSLVNNPAVNILPNSDEVAAAIQRIVEEFRAGRISVAEMEAQLRKLPIAAGAIDSVLEGIKAARLEADNAAIAVEQIEMRLQNLDGQLANIKINVDVNDPMGILASGLHGEAGPGNYSKGWLESQYRMYGQGQRAARNATFLNEARRGDMLNAQDDQGQKIRDMTQALLEQHSAFGLTREAAAQWAEEVVRTEAATKESKKGASAAAKEFENFANKIAELRETAAGAFMSDLDKQVLARADDLKNGAAMMKEYIAAIQSGDLSNAPAQLLEIREALMQIGAADTWEQIITQYGTAGQLAGRFADKQAELNFLVSQGHITAAQASQAYADFLGQFSQYEWIDELSSALTNFASSAVTDFENIEDAVMGLIKQLGMLLLKMWLLEPLEQGLRGAFSGGNFWGSIVSAGVGGGLSSGPGIGDFQDVFEMHTGGTVGVHGRRRIMPATMNARRFHDGTKPNEIRAVLERGEEVLKQTDARRLSSTMNGLMSNVSSGGGGFRGELILSPDLELRILQQSGQQSVRISESTVDRFSRDVLPARVAKVTRDPRARGTN